MKTENTVLIIGGGLLALYLMNRGGTSKTTTSTGGGALPAGITIPGLADLTGAASQSTNLVKPLTDTIGAMFNKLAGLTFPEQKGTTPTPAPTPVPNPTPTPVKPIDLGGKLPLDINNSWEEIAKRTVESMSPETANKLMIGGGITAVGLGAWGATAAFPAVRTGLNALGDLFSRLIGKIGGGGGKGGGLLAFLPPNAFSSEAREQGIPGMLNIHPENWTWGGMFGGSKIFPSPEVATPTYYYEESIGRFLPNIATPTYYYEESTGEFLPNVIGGAYPISERQSGAGEAQGNNAVYGGDEAAAAIAAQSGIKPLGNQGQSLIVFAPGSGGTAPAPAPAPAPAYGGIGFSLE